LSSYSLRSSDRSIEVCTGHPAHHKAGSNFPLEESLPQHGMTIRRLFETSA